MLTLSFQLGHLGSGSNAFVKKAIYNGKLVAVKLFYKKGENREEDYLREVSTLKKVSHDNIIKLIKSGKWSEKNDLFNCMIIEFADTGSLYHGNGRPFGTSNWSRSVVLKQDSCFSAL